MTNELLEALTTAIVEADDRLAALMLEQMIVRAAWRVAGKVGHAGTDGAGANA